MLGAETLRKMAAYALAKPTRELLFTHVSTDAKYKSKLVLDVVVQRLGDTLGAAAFAGLDARSASAGRLALACAVASATWLLFAVTLGRRHERLSAGGAR